MPNKGTIRGTHHLTFCVGGAQEDYDFHVRLLGLRSVKKTVLFDGEIPIYHLYYGNGVGDGVDYSDPTTFRTIAVPNAVIPRRGRAMAASYDLVGVMAGYVPIDHVMLLAGGAIPLPDDWGGVNGTMYGAYGLDVHSHTFPIRSSTPSGVLPAE